MLQPKWRTEAPFDQILVSEKRLSLQYLAQMSRIFMATT